VFAHEGVCWVLAPNNHILDRLKAAYLPLIHQTLQEVMQLPADCIRIAVGTAVTRH